MIGTHNDSSFRRGYIHGVNYTIDFFMDNGADKEVVQRICDYFNWINAQWRYKDRGQMTPPPTYQDYLKAIQKSERAI